MTTARTDAGAGMDTQLVPSFAVIPGHQVKEVLDGREKSVVDVVEETYSRHAAGRSVNPPSTFLRFPDRATSRIIALPASLGAHGDESGVDGLKWISSFPSNVTSGIPRASAVLILNDQATGYPFACMESSIISAVRTAASAAAAADRLTRSRTRPARLGFVGAGLIARYIHTYLEGTGWSFDSIGVHDVSADSAAGFRTYLEQAGDVGRVTVHRTAEDLIRGSDLIVFATVADRPHISDTSWFRHNPVVLHVSLRDLAPEVLLASTNIVDDVEHCLRASTSPHLTESLTGNRDFLLGTLDDVTAGRVTVPPDRPAVFSPFGLGVLDLAVGKYVYDEVSRSGELRTIDNFFHELRRYG
ncbi:2,3-diaminopropionate biosynthesis protein SbnB [Streptomyces fuscigenes]|uniref:2,3-diaminopropionate biosynthesis protein SbnB n=1 Tax=Streptomyces fuscigenes TaxID=1528880 RepID=UPI001F23E2BA|nr:2,3-diaminopropionate biosynthesis protein SbnB [Streptomyces fuscigenes]MCF3960208.1 2,3-diaminopropionate biosynthesis protein SbnB [Streptomyces fuscigenes]